MPLAILDDEDAAMLQARAQAQQEAEAAFHRESPTVKGEIENKSGFSNWNAKRIARLRQGVT